MQVKHSLGYDWRKPGWKHEFQMLLLPISDFSIHLFAALCSCISIYIYTYYSFTFTIQIHYRFVWSNHHHKYFAGGLVMMWPFWNRDLWQMDHGMQLCDRWIESWQNLFEAQAYCNCLSIYKDNFTILHLPFNFCKELVSWSIWSGPQLTLEVLLSSLHSNLAFCHLQLEAMGSMNFNFIGETVKSWVVEWHRVLYEGFVWFCLDEKILARVPWWKDIEIMLWILWRTPQAGVSKLLTNLHCFPTRIQSFQWLLGVNHFETYPPLILLSWSFLALVGCLFRVLALVVVIWLMMWASVFHFFEVECDGCTVPCHTPGESRKSFNGMFSLRPFVTYYYYNDNNNYYYYYYCCCSYHQYAPNFEKCRRKGTNLTLRCFSLNASHQEIPTNTCTNFC